MLLANQKYADLVLLYRGRGLHNNALSLLKKYVNTQLSLKDDRLGQQDKDLAGTKPSIEYMKTLGRDQADLLLNSNFTHWLFKDSPIEALEVRTDLGVDWLWKIYIVVRKPSQQLPPVKVIEHLDSMVQRGIISDVLVVRYLEFIIHELMDETVVRIFFISILTQKEFHNKLVFHYFDIVLDLKKKVKDG